MSPLFLLQAPVEDKLDQDEVEEVTITISGNYNGGQDDMPAFIAQVDSIHHQINEIDERIDEIKHLYQNLLTNMEIDES